MEQAATAEAPAGSTSPRVRYVTTLDRLEQLTDDERRRLAPVAERYAFRLNDYYAGLIDWSDPEDPIRRLVVPDERELADYGPLVASDEESNTVARGVQHKYADTALLLCNEVCGAYWPLLLRGLCRMVPTVRAARGKTAPAPEGTSARGGPASLDSPEPKTSGSDDAPARRAGRRTIRMVAEGTGSATARTILQGLDKALRGHGVVSSRGQGKMRARGKRPIVNQAWEAGRPRLRVATAGPPGPPVPEPRQGTAWAAADEWPRSDTRPPQPTLPAPRRRGRR